MRLTWRDVTVDPAWGPIFTAITESEAAELARLAKGKRVLEIGSAYGYSTVVMGRAGAEEIFAVDPHQTHGSLQEFCSNIERHGLKGRVNVVVGTSQEAATVRKPDGSRVIPLRYFDMVFIDGDHTLEGVRHDRDWALRLIKPFGSIIAFHDYDEDTCPGITPALDEWPYKRSHLVDTLAVYSDLRPPL